VLRDSMYKNQTIHFNKNGTIKYDASSFFTIDLPDTLLLGKNAGKLTYNSNFKKASDQILSVIIENEYSDNNIKKDTFGNWTNNIRFGVFAHKTGKKIIRGQTLEKLFYKEILPDSSFKLTINNHKKYFEKEVYVKDTIN